MARQKHTLAEDLRRQLERAYEERDTVMAQMRPLVARSRDMLTGVYGTANMRKLGDHGFFTVDDTPRVAKPAKKVPTA